VPLEHPGDGRVSDLTLERECDLRPLGLGGDPDQPRPLEERDVLVSMFAMPRPTPARTRLATIDADAYMLTLSGMTRTKPPVPGSREPWPRSRGHDTQVRSRSAAAAGIPPPNVTIDGRAAPVKCDDDRKCDASPTGALEPQGRSGETGTYPGEAVPGQEGVVA
jgi:hypothetical protein